jgi:uracil phosphoribosyltransferase
MMHHLGKDFSVAHVYLHTLRHRELQLDRDRFRNHVRRLGELMAYEISRHLPFRRVTVPTPLAVAEAMLPEEEPVLITVLRAGLPYYEGFQHIFPQAEAGFAGASRADDEEEVRIELSYLAVPSLEGKTVLLIDPMLATGKSFVQVAHALKSHGHPRHVHVAALVGTPEGLSYLQEHFPFPYDVWLWALDEKLNSKNYIVPGLGDAGDLCYGEKK